MSLTGFCVMVMGVSGSGKTAVGKALAHALHGQFLDADDLHPSTNIDKMSAGIPLTDEDRLPWLLAVSEAVNTTFVAEKPVILACSALKKAYRTLLREHITAPLKIIYLKSSFEQVRDRLEKRSGHFMPANLLASQFEALEEPDLAEPAITAVDANLPIDQVIKDSLATLN